MAMKMTGAVGVLLLLLLPFVLTAVTNDTMVMTGPAFGALGGCATRIAAANQACVYLPSEDYVELHQNGGHHRRHSARPFTDCCRWLRAVDEECVCKVLRCLPPALFIRRHSYKISIGNACVFTYKCEGGF